MQELIKKANSFDFGDIPFSRDDFGKITSCYEEIQKLMADYASSYSRKQVAAQINEKIDTMCTVLALLEQNLECMTFDMDEEVTDYLLAMRVIVRLANSSCNKYDLKIFKVAESPYSLAKNIAPSNIWVIGEKEVLNTLSPDPYFGSNFKSDAARLIAANHPLIIATDLRYNTNVIPYNYRNKAICTYGSSSNIYCFAVNNDLNYAITKFVDWTCEFGSDIKGLDEDTLFENIKNH